jgi:ribonuclease HI
LRSRYVLAYKKAGTREQSLKARLVVQAMRKLDNDYHSLFTYAPTVTKASTRLLLTVAAGLEMKVATRDISQAYVCTTKPLLRDVYVIPPKEAKVTEDELWLLKRPLYGLPESGAMWYATYAQHHRNKLEMRPTIVDPAVFVKHDAAGKLVGLCVLQVDDSLICGTADFLRQEEINSVAFPSKGRTMVTETPVEFNGSVLQRTKQGFEVNQNAYVESIPSNPIPRTAADFAAIRGKMAYATANTRPALSCAINQSAQTRAELAEETDFKKLEDAVTQAKANPLPLLFPKLDLDSVVLRVYADSSFANNRDLSSQLGCAIYLVDNDRKCALLHWSSKKARRVTRSTMAAELFALINAFDVGLALQNLASEILGRKISINVFTDSQTAWDSVTSLCSTTEKRLLIDIYGLRESYRTGELQNLCRIDTRFNPSDVLTKINSGDYFAHVLRTNRLDHPIAREIGNGSIEK